MSAQQLNLSLDQHALPGRTVPTTSGGFLNYPSKIRSLRDPIDISKTSNGAPTKLILDLGISRGQSPGEGRRLRESLEEMSEVKASANSIIFDPSSSQVVQHFRNQSVRRQINPPSLIGGSGFSESLTKRNLEGLKYAKMRRGDASSQTAPAFAKLDLSDLADYKEWNKGKAEPFLKELRQAILTNRPENIAEFTLAWALAMAKGDPPPVAWLPGEEESMKLLQMKEQEEAEGAGGGPED